MIVRTLTVVSLTEAAQLSAQKDGDRAAASSDESINPGRRDRQGIDINVRLKLGDPPIDDESLTLRELFEEHPFTTVAAIIAMFLFIWVCCVVG